jgi:hypothetical protein
LPDVARGDVDARISRDAQLIISSLVRRRSRHVGIGAVTLA